MNLNDTLTLIRAGYSKAEIEALEAPAPAPEGSPETPPAAEPEQTEKPAEPAPEAAEPQTPDDGYARLEKLLNQFIGVAQARNVNTMNMAGAPAQKSSTDILAQVIAPPRKEIK